MPDLLLSVQIDRTDLGLASLDLNDHNNYYISSDNFLGGQVQYERNQVTSPFIDGSVTVNRRKQIVTDQMTVEVLGVNKADLITNINNLVLAFSQDTYNLQIAYGSVVYQYACEAADYTVQYSGPRWIANHVQVQLSFPRQPVPTVGVF